MYSGIIWKCSWCHARTGVQRKFYTFGRALIVQEMLIVSPVTSVVALMDKGMVLEQIKKRKTFKAVCRRLNVLVSLLAI